MQGFKGKRHKYEGPELEFHERKQNFFTLCGPHFLNNAHEEMSDFTPALNPFTPKSPQNTNSRHRSEAWDQETMFSQLAKRSSQNVDSGVCHNKYSDRRSTYLK